MFIWMFGGAAWRTPTDHVIALKVFIITEKVHVSNTPTVVDSEQLSHES